MKVFGLTGGIGVGKSVAEQWLRKRDVSVVDTDLLARQIVEPGSPALEEIQTAFGNTIVSAPGQLRRDELARIVFSDESARRRLESILHPRIRELWKQQLEIWRAGQKRVGVVIIPLLFETGAEGEFDAIICVACSRPSQHDRLLKRGWTPAQIEQRIAAQWPMEKKMAGADYVVWTEGSLEVFEAQLDRLPLFR
jgi:dephospho-CoA kinase